MTAPRGNAPTQSGRWRALGPHLAPPILGILALMLFLTFGRPPSDGYGWRTLFEIGHMPLFGVTGLLMLRVVHVLQGGKPLAWPDILVALLATVVLSLVAEASQLWQPGRNASVGDALSNLTGALCFIAIAASFRPQLWQPLGPDGPVAARLVLAGAALVLALAVMPLFGVAWHYHQRAAAFPVVGDLTRNWQRPFLSAGRADMARVPAPPGWRHMQGKEVARLTFLDAPWPGFTIREPYPDWSGYASLRFQVWSELDGPVEIVLRVDDTHRTRPHADRYNASFIVLPGLNDFAVPLQTIARGPRKRELDLADVSQLVLFSRRPEEPFELYFSPIWLEGAPAEP